jgi:lipopolysaccharide export system permease protein
VPALVVGLLVSLLTLYLSGWLVPHGKARSEEILLSLRSEAPLEGNLDLRIPEEGPTRFKVVAERFDINAQALSGVVVLHYEEGQFAEFFYAESASWRGTEMVLREVQKVQETSQGMLEQRLATARLDLGRTAEQATQLRQDPRRMTLPRLRQLVADTAQLDTELAREAREEYHLRIAVPWAALGLALIGLPLGLRPQRTSTGVGLGISLAIILAYYIVLSMMSLLGSQGSLPPALANWIPNILLYTTGLGLLLVASR